MGAYVRARALSDGENLIDIYAIVGGHNYNGDAITGSTAFDPYLEPVPLNTWLGTPDRGRAPFDLSSTAAAGVLAHPGRSVTHLFNPASAPRGLILLAPGGGQDHTSPGVVARATRLADDGYAIAVVRSLDEVPAVLAEHPDPVGFWGIS
ncbi:MAG TPA: hypothetical protein VGS60_09795 [Actinomycetes bacterium]|nr:hypothetical protein [Actinomycetes bacterium]